MNALNPIEIAARNYAANITGYDLSLIDLMFASDPTFAEATYDQVAKMISGPFGTLMSSELSLTEAEAGIEGYVKALEEVIEHLDNSTIMVPCDHAAQTIHTVFQALKKDIRDRIAEVTADDEEEQLELPLDASILFGALQDLGFTIVSPQG